jgi:phenylalanyl-tRNA synthetase beta chain
MAIVKFSRKEFEKFVGKIDEKMQEKIALFGTPFESLNQEEIELEIFPDRPDLYSLQGYVRSFLAFLGKKTCLKDYKINKPEKNYEVKIDKSVREVRPYTACAIVKGLKFNDEKIKEIIDIQEKLHATIGRNRRKVAIGIYPLETITLPIKFEARKPENIKFVPLESTKVMSGPQILRQHPAGRDYAHLLSGMKKFPVFVDASGEILSMPPIINSHKTGKITEKTKDVFIECSGFDFEILKKTLNILVTMLADIGGKVYQMRLRYSKQEITPDLKPEKLKINLENINKLLGLELKETDFKKLVEKMGYNYKAKNSEVEIPAWRTDILHEVDIAEDVAIAYGYDKFKPEVPEVATIGEESEIEIKKRKISEILVGLSLLEISTYHLLTKQDMKKLREKVEIEVEKSKTDYKVLRPSLLPSILKVLSENLDSEYPQKIFEIGKVFSLDEKQETGILEKEKLAIAITPSNFTELRQILEYLARMLNIEVKIEETENEKFIEGRTGKVILKEKEIGIIGEIHPSLLRSWHLKMPLVYLEIDLSEILRS